MLKVKLSKQVITSDDSNYILDGMVEPILYNEGETSVKIMNVVIAPGDSFKAGFVNQETIGAVPIHFVEEPGKENKVVCIYGKVSKETC